MFAFVLTDVGVLVIPRPTYPTEIKSRNRLKIETEVASLSQIVVSYGCNLGVTLRSLEVPDWRHSPIRPQNPDFHADFEDDASVQRQIKMRNFFEPEAKREHQEADEKKSESGAAERATNVLFGMALDSQVRSGLHIKFDLFLPPFKLAPLKADEERYMADVETASGTSLRSCIWDSSGNQGRLELPRSVDASGKRYSPSVHVFSDRGVVGRPYLQYLGQKVGINITEGLDFCHILAGVMGDLEKDIGVWPEKIQIAGAYTVLMGPFLGAGFWRSFAACSKDSLASLPVGKNKVFQYLFPRLCDEDHISPSDYYNRGFKAQYYKILPHKKTFNTMSFLMKLGRWSDFWDKHEAVKSQRAKFAYGFSTVCLEREYWPSFEKSPLKALYDYDYDYQVRAVDDELLDDEADADEEEDEGNDNDKHPEPARGSKDPAPLEEKVKRPVRQSNDEIKKQARQGKRNGIDYAAWTFLNPAMFRKVDAPHEVKSQLMTYFKVYLKDHKNPDLAKEFVRNLARGSITAQLQSTLRVFKDQSAFENMSFSPKLVMTIERKKEDIMIANLALDAWSCLAARLLLLQIEHEYSFPGILTRLVGTTEEEQNNVSDLHQVLYFKAVLCFSIGIHKQKVFVVL